MNKQIINRNPGCNSLAFSVGAMPTCAHCGVRIIGHGLENGGRMFCCNYCAAAEGMTELRDRS